LKVVPEETSGNRRSEGGTEPETTLLIRGIAGAWGARVSKEGFGAAGLANYVEDQSTVLVRSGT